MSAALRTREATRFRTSCPSPPTHADTWQSREKGTILKLQRESNLVELAVLHLYSKQYDDISFEYLTSMYR